MFVDVGSSTNPESRTLQTLPAIYTPRQPPDLERRGLMLKASHID
jgi:hypothetical protein